MIRIGLTGSIAMGKSTTARMFAALGAPVHDADAAVHRLYQAGAPGAEAIRAISPEAVTDQGVDRARLRREIAARPELLPEIEARIHPLVTADRENFVARATADGADAVVFDIPLLFETGAEQEVDFVVVVTADPNIQWERALARPGMSPEALEQILARQTPDAEKRRRADFVIDTSHGEEAAMAATRRVLAEIRARAVERSEAQNSS